MTSNPPVGNNISTEPQQVAAQYDNWASQYDEDIYKNGKYTTPEILGEFLQPRCQPTDEVLDAGCGSGAFSSTLQKLNLTNVTGIDFSKGMLAEAAKRNFYKALHQLNFAEPLTILQDNTFDIIVCLGVTTYLTREMPFLMEFIRVCKPKGYIVITYRDDKYVEDKWEDSFNDLIEKQLIEKVDQKTGLPYLPGCDDYKMDITFRYLAFRKL